MMIKAKTEYTKELLLKFARFNAYKQSGQVVTYIILELVMLVLASIFIFTSENTFEFIASISIITPLFLFMVPAIILVTPMLVARMSKNLIGSVNTYEFLDNEIVFESTLPTAAGQIKANYNYFESVYETKDVIYLYISKQQAFILNKSDITEGSVSDLQGLLRKNIPANKYIVKLNSSKFMPILIMIILAVVAFITVYSFLNLTPNKNNEKIFSKSGLTITLNDKFNVKEMVSYTAAFDSESIGVLALKEEQSLFGNKTFSLKEYAELVIANNKLDTTVKGTDNLTGFTFENHVNGKDYIIFATVYKSIDAYWLMQFTCESTKFEGLKSTIIQYAKSVNV